MKNCDAMRSRHQLTHLHIYSYRLFKKYFVENYEIQNFIFSLFCIRFTYNFHCSIRNVLLFIFNLLKPSNVASFLVLGGGASLPNVPTEEKKNHVYMLLICASERLRKIYILGL